MYLLEDPSRSGSLPRLVSLERDEDRIILGVPVGVPPGVLVTLSNCSMLCVRRQGL